MTVVNTGSKVLNALQSTTNATALMAGISGTGQGVERADDGADGGCPGC